MWSLIYNIIVRLPSHSSDSSYRMKTQKLAQNNGIDGPFILVGERTIMVVSSSTLDSELSGVKKYSSIPDAVAVLETQIEGTDETRWVVTPKGMLSRVKFGLPRSGALKGNRYFDVEIGDEIYETANSDAQTPEQETLVRLVRRESRLL